MFQQDGSYQYLPPPTEYTPERKLYNIATKKALNAFNRLYMLVLVKAISGFGNEPPDLLVGPLQAWRLARLMGKTFSIVSMEFIVSGALGMVLDIEVIDAILILVSGAIIGLGTVFLAARFTASGFDRVCLVLFSLWYDAETSNDVKQETVENAEKVDE